jgi:hypothetical protein
MRSGRPACLAALLFAFAASPALAATPRARVALLFQPTRADFDRDGRPDTAALGARTNPVVVRVTLSRAGMSELFHASPVLAIASVDYDSDGDVDLLVGTSEGTVVWLNNGRGAFSPLPLHPAATRAPESPDKFTATPASNAVPFDRNERTLAATAQPARAGRDLLGHMSPLRISSASLLRTTACAPRAPPRL